LVFLWFFPPSYTSIPHFWNRNFTLCHYILVVCNFYFGFLHWLT
jgi:hypothetical protein